MYTNLSVLLFFVLSTVLTAVIEEHPYACKTDEFACGDGACVGLNELCDGRRHCVDGSDEENCPDAANSYSLPSRRTVIQRTKRQTRCNKRQWQCRDGSCISFDGKCDGVVDCPDKSDETFPLCRKSPCQSNWFRCTYGACVDGTAPCNGVQDCADNSDELLPRCRNETEEVRGQFRCADGQVISASEHCDGTADCADGSDETVRTCAAKPCPSYLFRCAYGACVDQGADCNGVQECADGSDESDELCNRMSLPKPVTKPDVTTQPTTSGKCVLPAYPEHGRYEVGGVPQASPGQSFPSLQMNVTCNRGYGVIGDSSLFCFDGVWSRPDFPQCVRFCQLNSHPSVEYRCVVSGNSIEGTRQCNPQEPSGTIVVPQCRAPNYYYPGVLNRMQCIDGSWDYIAICNPGLNQDGTNITILIKDQDMVEVYVGNFTYMVPLFNLSVIPLGNLTKPNFTLPVSKYSDILAGIFNVTLPNINISIPVTENAVNYDIDENDWRIGSPSKVNVNIKNSSVVINAGNVHFTNECGRITPAGDQLIIDGRVAKRGELPWHAGIYRKTTTPYMQICGGSLVSTTVVISAAHCFWSDIEKLLPASNYATAVGKLYRPWNNPQDPDAQKSDVSDIKVPKRYQGAAANFQEDIAILLLVTAIEYKVYVRPVCVDFDVNFDRKQLQKGKMGKVAGWGLTEVDGGASQVLKVVDLPYVEIDECISQSPPGFREYITSDKICAGYTNGTALCKGDSGGGLVFPESDRGTERFYLRGVVSTAPTNEHACNAFTLTSFTQLIKHEHFIKEYARL